MTELTESQRVESLRQQGVGDTVIYTQNLAKRFGDFTAVENVNLEVPRGSIFGFIGPSGSGKTTTIRMLTGNYRPSEGLVKVFDTAPHAFSRQMRARIGYMPQFFVMYPDLSVWENLSFSASIYGVPLRRKKRLMELLDFVELTDHRKKIVRNISGGMQRRLSLAATLVHKPELIFLDEPTAGVDPVLRSKFWDHFRALRDDGATLFVTTQYVSEANYCDFVGVMGEGTLLTVDTPEGLRQRAYGGDMVFLRTAQPLSGEQEQQLRQQPYVRKILHMSPRNLRLVVDEAGTATPLIMTWAQERDITVESVEEFLPPFDDVFVELVQGARQNGA